jgi:hypothetical protein
LVAELGLAAGAGVFICLRSPSRVGAGSLVIDLVIDLVALKAGSQGSRNGARDSETLVSVIKDMEESEASVLIDGRLRRRVDEVPGRSNIGIGNVEGLVKIAECMDCVY